MVSNKKEGFPLKGMASTKRNALHQTECLPLKGMVYTKRNGLLFLLVEDIPSSWSHSF